MSQESVDQIRKALDAFNRRDLDAMLEGIDPAVEWSPPTELPGASTVRGHDGVRQSVADMLEAFGDLRADPERFIDLGDRVIALYHWRGKGSGSGISVDQLEVPVGMLATMRDGLVVRARFFITWDAASKPPGSRSRRCRSRTGAQVSPVYPWG
jgi:ketosteroid isomerase-like protein